MCSITPVFPQLVLDYIGNISGSLQYKPSLRYPDDTTCSSNQIFAWCTPNPENKDKNEDTSLLIYTLILIYKHMKWYYSFISV